MNRKEGILMTLLLLGTFVTGAYATGSTSQLLNVFVTNFPQKQNATVTNFPSNVVVKVLDHNYSTISTDDFNHGVSAGVFVSATIDVSQYSHITLFYNLTLSQSLTAGWSWKLTQFFLGPDEQTAVTLTAPGGSVFSAIISTSIEQPMALARFEGAICCDGWYRVQIYAFLQR